MPPVDSSAEDLWPSDITPDLTDVDVAIARTMPAIRIAAGHSRMRGAVPRFDCPGEEDDLHREPVLHQRQAGRRAGGAARGAGRPGGHRHLAEGMPWLARTDHDGGVSRQRVPAAARRRRAQASAARVSGGLALARCADVHPLEGDDRRRRAGADRIGELFASLDGHGHGMRSGGRRRRQIPTCARAFAACAIGFWQNISACLSMTSAARSSAWDRSAR